MKRCQKIHKNTINLKCQPKQEIDNLSYLMDHILYHQKYDTFTDNPLLRIYVNEIENKISLKLKHDIFLNF